ncbi:hypothetical protein E4U53_008074 [Claviceps sorghi]|nr:hypothetical protein E4U53_008074 [Claviceps sorghi]
MNHLSRLHHGPPQRHASPAAQARIAGSSRQAQTSLPQVASSAVGEKRPRGSDEDEVKLDETNEGDGRKKRCRGRPRKDTKDETAADRRRTQIRLAQRAYRHRKDTAITTLEKRVKELEKANDDIGRDFNAFFDILVSERLLDGAPEALQRLSSIAGKITAAADKDRVRNDDTSASDDDDDEADASGSSLQYQRVHASSSASHNAPSRPMPEQDTLQQEASFQQANYPTTCRVPLTAEAAVASIPSTSYSAPLIYMPPSVDLEMVTTTAPQNAGFPFYSSMEPCTVIQYEENTARAPSPYQTLHAPLSFATSENTFGRRLQRSTCENALRLLMSSHPPPDRFAAVFGFCLLFETREDIRRRLQTSLNSSQHEDLCFWKTPFTNLGGAGTFFQDQPSMRSPSSTSGSSSGSGMPIGNQGTQSYGRPQQMTGMSMGPWGAKVQETRDQRIDYGTDRRMQMMLAGFEGDFFDPDEVETHLRQLGIFIPPRADFVNAEVLLDELEGPEQKPRANGGFVLQNQQSFYGSVDSAYENGAMNATGRNSNSSSASGPVGSLCTADNPFMAEFDAMAHGRRLFSAPAAAPGSANGSQRTVPSQYLVSPFTSSHVWPEQISWPNKVKITIDVNVLARELTSKSVCLGRSPGVRRKDIKTAIKIAAGLIEPV